MDDYLEIWRIRIGLFVHGRKSSKLKNVHNDSVLKSMHLIFPLHRAVLFFALASSLIIVSGDIEINPGPKIFQNNEKKVQISQTLDGNFVLQNPFICILQADIHQADSCFSAETRGRQCVANCYAYLLKCHITDVQTLRSTDLHNLLFTGDFIYSKIQEKLGYGSSYLLLTDIPKYTYFDRTVFSYNILKTYSGYVHQVSTDAALLSLHSSLFLAFVPSFEIFSIIIIQSNAIGVYFDGNGFFIFDPHCCDENGLCLPEGTSVIGRVSSQDDLYNYLIHLAKSLCSFSLQDIPYEVNVLNLKYSKQTFYNQSNSEYLLNCNKKPEYDITYN